MTIKKAVGMGAGGAAVGTMVAPWAFPFSTAIGGGVGFMAGLMAPGSNPYGTQGPGGFNPYQTSQGYSLPQQAAPDVQSRGYITLPNGARVPVSGTNGTANVNGVQAQMTASNAMQAPPMAFDPYAGSRFGQAQAGGGDLVRAPQGMDQTSPGFGEQWFNQQQNAWMGPQASQDAYGQSQQAFGAPGQGEQYWQGLNGAQNGQQASEQVFGQAQSMGPGMSQDWAQRAAGASPSGTQVAWGNAQGLQGPGAVQNFAGAAIGQAQAPSASGAQYGQAQGVLGDPSRSANYAQQNAGDFQGQTASEQYFASAIPQMQNQPRNAQDVYNGFTQGPAGMDAYYDRASELASEDVNRALAAQGLMGSSYGASTVGDAMKDIRADQARAEGDYYLRQTQLAGQLAQSADQGGLDYYRTGGQLAQGADAASLAQSLGGAQVMGQADQAELARMGLLGNMAGQSDQQRLAGLELGGQFANMSSQEQMARMGLYGDLGAQMDRTGLDYMLGGGQLAGQADQQRLAQMGLLGDLAGQSDAQRLNADLGYGGMAFNAQQAEMARAGMGFEQGMALDQFGVNSANSGMQAAMAAQNAYQGRGQQQFENEFLMSQQLALMAQQNYEAQLQADQRAMDAALAAEAGLAQQQYLSGVQQQQQTTQDLQGAVGTAGDAMSMYNGMGGGRGGAR